MLHKVIKNCMCSFLLRPAQGNRIHVAAELCIHKRRRHWERPRNEICYQHNRLYANHILLHRSRGWSEIIFYVAFGDFPELIWLEESRTCCRWSESFGSVVRKWREMLSWRVSGRSGSFKLWTSLEIFNVIRELMSRIVFLEKSSQADQVFA